MQCLLTWLPDCGPVDISSVKTRLMQACRLWMLELIPNERYGGLHERPNSQQ